MTNPPSDRRPSPGTIVADTPRLDGITVLIVDKHEDTVEMLAQALRFCHASVVTSERPFRDADLQQDGLSRRADRLRECRAQPASGCFGRFAPLRGLTRRSLRSRMTWARTRAPPWRWSGSTLSS
jgi:hypothetical protein